MSKLETFIYIVGAKRTWQLRERYIKFILAFICFLFLGLGMALAYQSIRHFQVVEEMEIRSQRERQKNKKLQSVLKDLRQRVVDRRTVEVNNSLYNSTTLEELMRKNSEQTKQIATQKTELVTLKTENRQLIQELQQLRYQHSNAEKRLSILQQANQKLKDKSAKLALDLEESIQETNVLQRTKQKLEAQSAKSALNLTANTSSQATVANTSSQTIKELTNPSTQVILSTKESATVASIVARLPIFIDDLQLRETREGLSVKFKLRNKSKIKQQGRLGIFVISAQERKMEIPFSIQDTDSFSIQNFKQISEKYQNWSKLSFLRIVAWNTAKIRILDQYYSLTNLN